MGQQKWTSDETDFLEQNMGVVSASAIASRLKRSISSVEKKRRRIRHDANSGVSEQTDESKDVTIRRVIDENKELKRRLDKAQDVQEAVLNSMDTAFKKGDKIPQPKKFFVNTKSKNKHACHMGLELSDFQLGMLVKPEDTINLGGYDFETFKRRMERLKEVTITIAEEQRLVRPIEDLVVFGLGDYVEGEQIFPSQAFFIDMCAADQFIEGVNYLSEFLRDLACYFRNVKFYGVWGNHGRMGKFGHGHHRSNLDYLLLKTTQSRLQHIKNIQMHVSTCPCMAVQIHNEIHLLRHGDDTNSWSGVPFYGMERDSLKYANLLRLPIDHAHVGHHHRQASWEVSVMSVHMNGSVCGPTPFGVSRMKMADAPSQCVMMFHPEHGMNWRIPIKLETSKPLNLDENGIFTPYS